MGLVAPLVVDGPINGELFLAYVRQQLILTLTQGDVVVMDNLPAHKVQGVRQAIEQAGARLLYLPTYSLDFNPIEQVFAKLKALLRKAASEPSTNSGKPSPAPAKAARRSNAGTTSANSGYATER